MREFLRRNLGFARLQRIARSLLGAPGTRILGADLDACELALAMDPAGGPPVLA